jgi:hypothetical protein
MMPLVILPEDTRLDSFREPGAAAGVYLVLTESVSANEGNGINV